MVACSSTHTPASTAHEGGPGQVAGAQDEIHPLQCQANPMLPDPERIPGLRKGWVRQEMDTLPCPFKPISFKELPQFVAVWKLCFFPLPFLFRKQPWWLSSGLRFPRELCRSSPASVGPSVKEAVPPHRLLFPRGCVA